MRAAVAFLLVALAVPAVAGEPTRHERQIPVGAGQFLLLADTTHHGYIAPLGSVGFHLTGDVLYSYSVIYHEYTWYRVYIYSRLGALDTPYTLEWAAPHPDPNVVFEVSPRTNCADPACRL